MLNYVKFEQKIIDYDLRSRWRDGLFAKTEEQKNIREKEKYAEAKKDFSMMMNSPKNDGSGSYHLWALRESLGIKPYKAYYRNSQAAGARC